MPAPVPVDSEMKAGIDSPEGDSLDELGDLACCGDLSVSERGLSEPPTVDVCASGAGRRPLNIPHSPR